jgi:3-hydroxyisobutyrate dehydrogenase
MGGDTTTATATGQAATAAAERPSVGFIGLGKMGAPMARRCLAAGFPLTVHNRSRPAVDALAAEGATPADDPAAVAAAADIVVTSLPDVPAVEAVYLGDRGLVGAARPGQVFVDTSTVGPDTSRKLAEALVTRGAGFLDAPVSGGVAGAMAGTLTIMVGGDADAYRRVAPVLAAMGQRIHHVGPTGIGATVKLANQLLVAINMAGVAEALVLATKAGADPRVVLEVVGTSFGGSRMLDRAVPLFLERSFAGGTPVDLIRKDLGLIADLAGELGVPLAEGATARRVFDAASAAGHGPEDMAAVVVPLEELANVRVVPPGA